MRESIDQDRWRQALLAELAQEAKLTRGRTVVSVFFGGGTPSLMAPQTVGALIDAVAKHWGVASNLEITLEANPSSVEAARFREFNKAGVNRVSLGVQALEEAALQFLGRRHTLHEALAALDIARTTFERATFDLIYARPGQSLMQWESELARALNFGLDHLSLYQLTIEPQTRFAELYRRGDLVLPDEDLAADLYAATQEQMAAAGLPAYEVSNHARPGCESRHNLVYWTYGDYIGIGPGAHGRRNSQATVRYRKPEAWLDAVETSGSSLETADTLTSQDKAKEALLMGLRLTQGIEASWFQKRTGLALSDLVDPKGVVELVELGLIEASAQQIAATPAGFQVLNSVIERLVR